MNNLKAIFEGSSFHIKSPETDDERAMRLRIEEANARASRVKGYVLFATATLSMFSIGVVCLYTAATTTDPETSRWSTGIVASLASGLVGYLLKR